VAGLTQSSTQVILRLVLYQDEVYRLPEDCRAIRARSGRGWVTFAGRDIVLESGEEARLSSGKDFAVVSCVGQAPLILEILGNNRQRPILTSNPIANPSTGT
jgi:hypothetical protein